LTPTIAAASSFWDTAVPESVAEVEKSQIAINLIVGRADVYGTELGTTGVDLRTLQSGFLYTACAIVNFSSNRKIIRF